MTLTLGTKCNTQTNNNCATLGKTTTNIIFQYWANTG